MLASRLYSLHDPDCFKLQAELSNMHVDKTKQWRVPNSVAAFEFFFSIKAILEVSHITFTVGQYSGLKIVLHFRI